MTFARRNYVRYKRTKRNLKHFILWISHVCCSCAFNVSLYRVTLQYNEGSHKKTGKLAKVLWNKCWISVIAGGHCYKYWIHYLTVEYYNLGFWNIYEAFYDYFFNSKYSHCYLVRVYLYLYTVGKGRLFKHKKLRYMIQVLKIA